VKIGMKLTVMSSSEKKVGRATSFIASTITRRGRPGASRRERTSRSR
jgi:hypothetical protein